MRRLRPNEELGRSSSEQRSQHPSRPLWPQFMLSTPLLPASPVSNLALNHSVALCDYITFLLTWEQEVCLPHLFRNAFPGALHTCPGAFASLSISEQLPVSPPALTCRAVPPLPLCLPRGVHLDTPSVSFSVGSVLRALFKMGISPTPLPLPLPLNPDWLLTGDTLNLLIEFIVKFPSPSARR